MKKESNVIVTGIHQFEANEDYVYVKEFSDGRKEQYRCLSTNDDGGGVDLIETMYLNDTKFNAEDIGMLTSKTYQEEIDRIDVWKFSRTLNPEYLI